MATLYTLDWYKRNYGNHYPPQPTITARPPATTQLPPGQLIDSKTPSTAKPTWRPPKQPGVPVIAPCKDAQCQTYCCGDHFAYKTDTGAKTADVDVVVALPGAKPEENKYVARDGDEQLSRSRRFNSESPIVSNSVLPGASRSHLDVRIDIPEFNITLDQRWCQGGVCQRSKEGRFDLYIPISTYMPTIPLEVVFE